MVSSPELLSVEVNKAQEADDASTTKVVQEGQVSTNAASVEAPILPVPTDNSSTKAAIVRPKPRRRNTKFQEEPKPIGALGRTDDLGFHEARWALNGRVPYFQHNNIPNVWMKHTDEDQDWDDFKNLTILFPHWKLTNNKALGARQIPKCLFLDAQNPKEKLVVLNWWRGLAKDEQASIVAHDQIHRYYRAPMRSNSPYKFCQRVAENSAFEDPMGGNNNNNNSQNHILTLNPSQNHQHPKQTQQERDQQASDHGRGAPLILTTKHQEPPTVLCFRAIRTAQQLVKRFQLSIGQLFCARVLEDKECCVENCHYPALDQNRNCCFLHKQMWWPRTTVEHFQKRRGHLLLGMEYAVRPSKKDILTTSSIKVHPVPCGCSNPLCEGIGWSAETVRVPKGWNLPPSIVPNVHCDKDRPLRLAPWHFPPQYRLQLPDGSWKFALNKTADFPSPDYDLEDFLKEPGMVEYQSRKSPWLLPDWVYAMQAVEQGPMTLAELQFRAVWNQRNQLMEGMAWETIHHHELSQTHQQVNSKLEEMKKTHVHKRKLKKKKKQPSESPKKKSRSATENYLEEDGMSDDEHQPNLIMANTGNNTGNNNNNRNHPSSLPPPRPLLESFAAYRDENIHEGALTGIQYLHHHAAAQQNQLQSPNPNLHHLAVNNHPHHNLLHQHLQQQQQQQQQHQQEQQQQQQALLHQQSQQQQQQQQQLHTLHHSTSHHLYHPTMPLLLQQAQQQSTQGQHLQLPPLTNTAGFFPPPLGGDGTDMPGGAMGRLPNSTTGISNMNTNTNSSNNASTTTPNNNNSNNPYQTEANRGRWGGFFTFR